MTKKMQECAVTASEKFVTRRGMEVLNAEWKSEDDGAIDLVALEDERFMNVSVRFDIISMLVLSEDRALLRHHINCLGADFTDSTD